MLSNEAAIFIKVFVDDLNNSLKSLKPDKQLTTLQKNGSVFV